MNSKALWPLAVSTAACLLVPSLRAQAPHVQFPAASPACTLKQRVGFTDIDIAYSRPSAKGRVVFGGIVPYGQVWRTGANQATRISFSTPVQLDGHDIPAGTYALFTIPGKDNWTIILNKDAHQWGAFQYNANDDLVRFDAEPLHIDEAIETFTIEFNRLRDQSAILNLVWANTVVPIRVHVNVVSKVVSQIEAAMAAPGKKSAGFYFEAATFYYVHGQNLHHALNWVNAGLAQHPRTAYELLHLKAELLAKLGDKQGAIAAAQESTKLALKAEGPASSFPWMNQQIISSLR